MKTTALALILTVSALIFLSTCKKEKEIKVELPTISTLEVTEVSINSAKSGGNITNDGGGDIITKGIVWSISQNPSVEFHTGITTDGTGTGVFESNLTELASNTTYYLRSYAKNSAGVAYGNQEQFNTGVLPEVEFSAAPVEGHAPLRVVFNDHSTNNPVTWQWSFGDGNTSTQQNPIHTYIDAGIYSVQLTVSNNYGSDTEIKNNYVIATTFICGNSTFTDIDGNIYNTVLIGGQCWMKENLRTNHYRNGTPIANIADFNEWSNLTKGAFAWYDNDISWKNKYGALYNWHTTIDTNVLCPNGWSVPTDAQWTQLVDYIASQGYPNDLGEPHSAGNALKSCQQVNSPLGGDCNTSLHPRWEAHGTHYGFNIMGFSALPGGIRDFPASFSHLGINGIWWSSSEYSELGAWAMHMYNGNGGVGQHTYGKKCGLSVRCVRQ